MEEIVWKVSVNNQKVDIRVETKPSSRRDSAVKLIYVQIDGYTYCFVAKIVNKGYRSREANNFNATRGSVADSGIAFLVNEINIRMQLELAGLCKLMAVRDSENFTFLFEELCDMGVAMVNTDGVYVREKRTLELPAVISRVWNVAVDQSEKHTMYSEAEACFIMWHVFRTIQELHNSQICHLDIRPDNIYFTSEGGVKLGGLCYLSNFRNDLFGGLRSNLPGRKEFLLPEYWQGGRVSCYAADIWAAAVSLYVLVKGTDPFPIDRLDRHMERMSHYSAFPEMEGLSAELQELLKQCLNPRMTLRPTLETILQSPWFEQHGFTVRSLTPSPSWHVKPAPSVSEASIPAQWTSPDMVMLNGVIDSCFRNVLDVMYGGVELAGEDVAFQSHASDERLLKTVASHEAVRLLSGKHLEARADRSENVTGSLPKKGRVWFRSGESCPLCWRRTELYVERGSLVVGGLRKPDSHTYSVLDIATIVFTEQNPRLFTVSWKDGTVLRFKAGSKSDAYDWYHAIKLAVALSCSVCSENTGF